jgi:hypothetical protein
LDKKHWYVPKSVETSQGGKATTLWNQKVQTGRTIPNNKLDIIICDNEKGTCMLRSQELKQSLGAKTMLSTVSSIEVVINKKKFSYYCTENTLHV